MRRTVALFYALEKDGLIKFYTNYPHAINFYTFKIFALDYKQRILLTFNAQNTVMRLN